MRDLVDVHYPRAERIRVVMDNLSTHSASALYETFDAVEASIQSRGRGHDGSVGKFPDIGGGSFVAEIETSDSCLLRRIDIGSSSR